MAFCFLELPTGYLADRYGNLNCLKAGGIALIAANYLPVWSPTYTGFLAHFLLIALARSLVSGASSAYLYDFLAARGRSADYRRIEGNARAYGLAGKVVFWSAIGYLMKWRLQLPYELTVGAAVISVIFAYRLPAGRVPGTLHAARPTHKLSARWEAGLSILRRSPILPWLMLQGVGIFVLARIAQVNLFQPILGAQAFDLGSYGTVMSAMTIFEAIGSAKPDLLQSMMGRRAPGALNSVYLYTAIMALSLAVIPWLPAAGTVGALCLFSLAAGLSFPVQKQLMNDAIPDSGRRATLLSAESLIDRAVCALVAASIGGFLAHDRLPLFLVLAGLGSLALLGAVAWGMRRYSWVGREGVS